MICACVDLIKDFIHTPIERLPNRRLESGEVDPETLKISEEHDDKIHGPVHRRGIPLHIFLLIPRISFHDLLHDTDLIGTETRTIMLKRPTEDDQSLEMTLGRIEDAVDSILMLWRIFYLAESTISTCT